jgi:uncharacterized protein YneF (UPF0154 family)
MFIIAISLLFVFILIGYFIVSNAKDKDRGNK